MDSHTIGLFLYTFINLSTVVNVPHPKQFTGKRYAAFQHYYDKAINIYRRKRSSF